jgi:hypothetical protein
MSLLPGAETLLVRDNEMWLVDPSARTIVAAPMELQVMEQTERKCAGRSMPRVDMPCTSNAVSEDREHRLELASGAFMRLSRIADGKPAFELGGQSLLSHAELAPRGASFDVFSAQTDAEPVYRLDGSAPGPALPRSTSTCKGSTQSLHSAIVGGAVYTSYVGGRMTACVCTDSNGCKNVSFGGGLTEYLMGASADGAALSFTTNSTMTETTVRLFRDGRQLAHAGVTGNCDRAVFAGKRLFIKCEPQPLHEAWLLELDPRSLAVLGRRVAPLGVIRSLSATTDAIALAEDGTVSVLPLDWVVNPNAAPIATHYLGGNGMVTERNSTLEVTGNADDVLSNARCWNGDRLFGLPTCESQLAKHP